MTRVINSDDCVTVGPETLNDDKAPFICVNLQPNDGLEYMVEDKDHISITRVLIKMTDAE